MPLLSVEGHQHGKEITMANSPSRETALWDMPYQPTRREGTPCVHDMLANLTLWGPGTPPSPRSVPPSLLEKASTTLKVRTPSDWTGPVPRSPSSSTIWIDPSAIISLSRKHPCCIAGREPFRKDLEYPHYSPSPTKKSLDHLRPSLHPLTPIKHQQPRSHLLNSLFPSAHPHHKGQ